MSDCNKIIERVCGDLAEDINSPLCSELKAHLEECDQCMQKIETMRGAVNLFQCLEKRQVPVEIHERLAKLLNVELPQG